ncbi:MAG: CaiB/BaiF CoA transferase family protein [Alphaproteobacteria bacterium]
MRESLLGLRVLDLTAYLSGPFATMTLAGLGADVIKIERRDGGDPARTFPPFCGPDGTELLEQTSPADESVAILKRNRGKRSVTLDLGAAKGREIFLRLAKRADVVIENLAPGVMERWGLDYATLAAENPQIILCSISGFGRTGPKKDLGAFDPIIQASSLTMATNGFPDGPPVRTGISFGDTVPALYAVIGILAAVRQRDRTGRGMAIDIPMHDSLVAMLMVEPVEAQVGWGYPLRTGSRIPRLAPCNVYSCRDGYVALNAAPPRLWRRLAKVMGVPELEVAELDPLAARIRRQEWLDQKVAAWVAEQTVEAVVALMAANGVPCAKVVETLNELAGDPSLRAHGMLHPVEHPLTGILPGILAPGIPVRGVGEVASPLRRAPLLGEHTDQILGDELGLDEAEISELRRQDIV